jgi:hypothetical protein
MSNNTRKEGDRDGDSDCDIVTTAAKMSSHDENRCRDLLHVCCADEQDLRRCRFPRQTLKIEQWRDDSCEIMVAIGRIAKG